MHQRIVHIQPKITHHLQRLWSLSVFPGPGCCWRHPAAPGSPLQSRGRHQVAAVCRGSSGGGDKLRSCTCTLLCSQRGPHLFETPHAAGTWVGNDPDTGDQVQNVGLGWDCCFFNRLVHYLNSRTMNDISFIIKRLWLLIKGTVVKHRITLQSP